MSSITAGSTTSKSYDLYMRDFYSSNRRASKSNQRNSFTNTSLVKADSSAIQKISKSLRDIEYSSDNGTQIFNTIKSFVTTYNNLYESASSSSEYGVYHPEKFIKSLTKDEKDALADLGITIGGSGKLTLDEDTLSDASAKKIGKVFSSDNTFTQKIKFYANKIYKAANHINAQA